MNATVQNWLDGASYDLETAQSMFETKRYIYAIFMCHLAIEKILKAKVQEVSNRMPPKTHDLEHLVHLSRITLPVPLEEFIMRISNLSVATRYSQDFSAIRS